jgi:ABC-2 type transport system permease protein
MRAIVAGRPVAWDGIVFGAVLAVVYVALSCALFLGVFRFAIRRGLIARYSAETVS